jgi:hypothetical protein
MKKASRVLARVALRRNLDARPPTQAELFLAAYTKIDQAQMCVEPVERLKEARQLIDKLIASYKAVH